MNPSLVIVGNAVLGLEVQVDNGVVFIKWGVRVGDWMLVETELLVPGVDASVGDTELLVFIKCGVEVDASVVVT